MMASPGIYGRPRLFLEWDGASLSPAPAPFYASDDSSFQGIMLVLPTAVLLTDFSEGVEIYTPQPGYRRGWAPEISRIHGAANCNPYWDLLSGKTYKISGRRFNGMTQGASYGGGAQQSATNYPLVRKLIRPWAVSSWQSAAGLPRCGPPPPAANGQPGGRTGQPAR